jgi:glucose-6-phosphate 1-epimerase
MIVTARTHPAGYLVYSLSAGEDQVVVSAFGGQILSWTRDGVPIIFENRDRAVMDGKTPYRGGAPICFPYFAKGLLMPLGTSLSPQHGRARTTVWDSSVQDSRLILATKQPTAEGYGPTEFDCELVYSLTDSLRIQATVRNLGEKEAPFQLAIHTYWATKTPSEAVIHGLGSRYIDNGLGMAEQHDPDSSSSHETPFDRVYPDAADVLNLSTEAYRVEIATKGCNGAVIWNPGPHHDIPDLGSPDFICVESGVISPSLSLAPGAEHVVELAYGAELVQGRAS